MSAPKPDSATPAFAKGQKVKVALTGAGITTREIQTVLRTNAQGVWLDNGEGNDPSGPFDPKTGLYKGPGVGGFTKRIEAMPPPKPRAAKM